MFPDDEEIAKRVIGEFEEAFHDYLKTKNEADNDGAELCGKFHALLAISHSYNATVKFLHENHHSNVCFVDIMLDFVQEQNNRMSALLTDIRLDLTHKLD